MQDKLKNLPYYRWLIFIVTVLGTFMAVLDSSIVNVALPLIAVSFGVELTNVQWVVTAYLLVISSLLPLFGKIGDMYGRRKIYLLGFAIFTIGSLLCSLSSTIWYLVVSRVLQGAGASMLMSNAPAIISVTFPGTERGRVLGMNGTVVALAAMVGPSLGGILVGLFNWKWIFYINLPIGVLAYLLGYYILPFEKKYASGTFDFKGAVLFALGMTGLLVVLSEGHEWGWNSLITVGIGVISLLLLSSFIWFEGRIKEPMIDLSLFKRWPFLAGNASGLLSFMAMFSNNMLMPFYLHSVLSLTPTQIGLAITPFPLLMAIAAPLSGYLSERVSPVLLTSSGLGILMLGLFYLADLDAYSTIWHVAVGQGIMGIGNGMFQSPNNNSVLSSVPVSKVGLASGISALMRNVGMVSGTAVAVSVFESKRQQVLAETLILNQDAYMGAFLSAYHLALMIGAFFAGIGFIISLSRKGHVHLRVVK